MGSLWGWSSRADLIAHLTREHALAEGYRFIKRRIVGKNHWYVYQRPDGTRAIGLDLILHSRKDCDWGYKSLTEEMGPSEVNCPLSLLKLVESSPTNDFGMNWRQAVRDFHARRAARPAMAAGVIVRYGERLYQLCSDAGPRRGWFVTALTPPEGGERLVPAGSYRMKAAQLRQAQVVDASTLPPIEQ